MMILHKENILQLIHGKSGGSFFINVYGKENFN